MRATWFAVHVLLAAALTYSVWLYGWTWGLLAFVPLVAVAAVVDLCALGGFTLDVDGSPLTGKDADRYARYRARMCSHQRDAFDGFLQRQREQRRFNPDQ